MLFKTIRHNNSNISKQNMWKIVSWCSLIGNSQIVIWNITKSELPLVYIFHGFCSLIVG